MDKNTLNYFGEVIALLSAWYSYECARLDEKPRDIDGNLRKMLCTLSSVGRATDS